MTKSRMEPLAKNTLAALGGDFRFGTIPGGGFLAGVNNGSNVIDEEAVAT